VSTERLAELIRTRQPCVVLTGAGASTESGIPDFRSAGGIWAEYDPMDYATIDAFRRDPAKVWDFYSKRLGVLTEAKPNPAHQVLAELERRGLVEAVITQNVDRLHERAGSVNVIEVHGSLRTSSCLDCGHTEPFDRVVELLPVPHCERCGAVLKPDVVMFGELLPAEAIERATTLAQQAALLLVVGSSLEVWPVAGLPDETLSHGGEVAIVNRDPTPYDGVATLVVHASAGKTLAEASRVLLRSGR
jgi:NAD-dependent deacetylase